MKLIDFPKISDARGNLSVIERMPFDIKRIYYLYDVHAGESRGGHAHRKLERIIVPLSGSFVAFVNGNKFRLHLPWQGLYIAPMEWLVLKDFSAGAVCLVVASQEYDEADYIRDKAEFFALHGGE